MIMKNNILLRLTLMKIKQMLIWICISTLISSILLFIGSVFLFKFTGLHPFIMILGGVNPTQSIDLLRTSIYLLVIFPPILSSTIVYRNANETGVLYRANSISNWWNSIIISFIVVCLIYVFWLFILVKGVVLITKVESFNLYGLLLMTFLLLFTFITFIGILNIVVLLVTRNEKTAIAVTMILILSAFINIGSEPSFMCFLPGSWGMLLRTKDLYQAGINGYLAVVLNILLATILTIIGKMIYKKRM